MQNQEMFKMLYETDDCATELRMCATLSPIKQPLLQLLEEEFKKQRNKSILLVTITITI